MLVTPSNRRATASLRALAASVAAVLSCSAVAACAADPNDAVPREAVPADDAATTLSPTTASVGSVGSVPSDGSDTSEPVDTADTTNSTADVVPSTTEAKLPIPPGVLVAVPQQNREDPAKGQFQLQMVNDTDDRFEVSSVQFIWLGYTTPVTPRDSTIVGGQTIDFPVAFPGASCTGDGTLDTMPPLDDAVVELGLADGSTVTVPVVDRWHLARRLYLEDCRRQRIAASVTIEWAELHEESFEGRPVTAGVLRLTRGTAATTITIHSVAGTIPYSFESVASTDGEPVVVLGAGDDVAEAPIRFTESRCDPHALAEAKQPHQFVAQIDLGDGELLPFVVVPDESDWVPMRRTADEACVVTGQVVFVGDETADDTSP